MMIPPGSLPGMTSFASAPTMSPMMIVQRIDMVASHRVKGLYDAETRLERRATHLRTRERPLVRCPKSFSRHARH